jgi:hypothetical protein
MAIAGKPDDVEGNIEDNVDSGEWTISVTAWGFAPDASILERYRETCGGEMQAALRAESAEETGFSV